MNALGKTARLAVALTARCSRLTACGGGDDARSDSGPAAAAHDHLDLQRGPPEAVQRDRRRVPQGATRTSTEITFDPLPFDNYTTTLTTQIAGGNAARPGLDPGELRPRLRLLRRAGAARRHAEEDDGLPVRRPRPRPRPSCGSRTASCTPTRSRPRRSACSSTPTWSRRPAKQTPAELIAAGQWNWEHVAWQTRPPSTRRPARPAWSSATSTTRRWDNLATVWGGWGAQAWSDDGKTCGFNSPEMVEAMTFLHKAIFTDKAHARPRRQRPTSSPATPP